MSEPLIPILNNSNTLTRAYAVQKITETMHPGEDSLLEVLSLLNQLPEPNLKEQALSAAKTTLSSLNIDCREELQSSLKKILFTAEHPGLRKAATDCLYLLWLNDFVDIKDSLINLFEEPGVDELYLPAIIELIGILGYPDLIPYLENYVKHNNPVIRRKSVEAYANIGGREAVLPLINAMFDTEKEVRETALWGLDIFWVSMKDQAVPILIELLNQAYPDNIKDYIISTLKRTGDKRADAVLEQIEQEKSTHQGISYSSEKYPLL
ncbi:HEAT repeat domain-containing protein [Candidatus Margulisiibacteriota bacterium]